MRGVAVLHRPAARLGHVAHQHAGPAGGGAGPWPRSARGSGSGAGGPSCGCARGAWPARRGPPSAASRRRRGSPWRSRRWARAAARRPPPGAEEVARGGLRLRRRGQEQDGRARRALADRRRVVRRNLMLQLSRARASHRDGAVAIHAEGEQGRALRVKRREPGRAQPAGQRHSQAVRRFLARPLQAGGLRAERDEVDAHGPQHAERPLGRRGPDRGGGDHAMRVAVIGRLQHGVLAAPAGSSARLPRSSAPARAARPQADDRCARRSSAPGRRRVRQPVQLARQQEIAGTALSRKASVLEEASTVAAAATTSARAAPPAAPAPPAPR